MSVDYPSGITLAGVEPLYTDMTQPSWAVNTEMAVAGVFTLGATIFLGPEMLAGEAGYSAASAIAGGVTTGLNLTVFGTAGLLTGDRMDSAFQTVQSAASPIELIDVTLYPTDKSNWERADLASASWELLKGEPLGVIGSLTELFSKLDTIALEFNDFVEKTQQTTEPSLLDDPSVIGPDASATTDSSSQPSDPTVGPPPTAPVVIVEDSCE